MENNIPQEKLFAQARTETESVIERFCRARKDWLNEGFTNHVKFLDLVVEWYFDDHKGTDRKQYLWEMFHRVINFGSPNLFMDSLLGFIGHELLDDGASRIDWRVLDFDSNRSLVWEKESNDFKHLVVTQDNPRSLPIVVYERDDGRAADVSELLEAMEVCFQRNRKHLEEILETQKEIQALMKESKGE